MLPRDQRGCGTNVSNAWQATGAGNQKGPPGGTQGGEAATAAVEVVVESNEKAKAVDKAAKAANGADVTRRGRAAGSQDPTCREHARGTSAPYPTAQTDSPLYNVKSKSP